MNFKNLANYIGEFKFDLIDGNGEYNFPDGTVYQGQFKEGLQHGMGCLSN